VSIIRRALGLETETRLFQSTSLIPRPGDGYIGEAGASVNVQTATGLTAVWAAVGLVADTIASLPADVYLRRGAARIPLRPRPSWLDVPVPADPNFTTWNHWHQVALSLLLHGNSYTYVIRNRRGEVVEVRVLNPERVTPTMIKDPKSGEEIVAFQIRANEGKEVILGPNEIIHIKRWTNPGEILGLSPIEACRTSLGGTIATEQFGARWFRNSGVPSGVIQVPGELTEEQAADIVGGWRRRHSGSNTPGILTGGATFQPIQVKPADIAWLDARKFGIDEVSRIFRVPTTKLSGETGNRSYNSIEADQTAFVVDSIRPWLELIERSYQRIVPGGADSFIKFNVDGLLRGDAKSRSEAYATGIRAGYMTVADVRRLEDLPPLGDELRQPLREVNLAPAALADQKLRADTAAALIAAGFAPDDAAKAAGIDIRAPRVVAAAVSEEQPQTEQTEEENS
jgi:HK97 family phage portal protein